ncbi:MAG: hypothetical protein ACYCXG_12110 [Acidiferrobacter sp.]
MDCACGKAQETPAGDGEQVLPFSVACEVIWVFRMELPTIDLHYQVSVWEDDIAAELPSRHQLGVFPKSRLRPAPRDFRPENIVGYRAEASPPASGRLTGLADDVYLSSQARPYTFTG